MGVTLTSKTINSTYDSLLKLSDNDQLTGAFKVITDGLGNDTGISINNTNQVNIAGQLVVNSSITANSFVRSGGLSSQFLKADGSVDSNTYQSVHQKGLANGYAPLDGGAKISEAYLPDSIVGQLEYQGTWNATTNTPTLPSASTVKGHYYVTSVAGTYQTIEYAVGDWVISNGTSWEKVDNTDAVTTVFGRIGAIVANSGDYSGFYHPLNGDLAANASTATTLQTARFINGTSFNGSANITTAIWGTSRTITIGDTGKSLNGSTNVTWSRAELGITKTNIDALNIDADTLDGQQGSYYAPANSLSNYLPLTGGTLTGELNVGDNVKIGKAGSQNYITFHGTTGDANNYGTTYIGERIYGGTEQSELILYKGNDGHVSTASPDRIRLIGANLCFDVYDIAQTYPTDLNGVGVLPTTRAMTILGNGNVGIGTSSPTAKLQVAGTTTYNSDSAQTFRVCDAADVSKGIHIGYDTTVDAGIIQAGDFGVSYRNLLLNPNVGNVGIGTTSPSQKFSVAGDVVLGQGMNRPVIYDSNGGNFRITPNNGGWATGYLFNQFDGTFRGGFGAYGGVNTLAYFWIGDDYNDATMVIQPNAGNVGIGTTSPNRKLSVNGNVGINNQLLLNSDNYGEHLSVRRGVYGYDTIVTGTRIDYSPTASTDTFKFLADLQTTGQLNVTNNAIINGNVGIGTISPNTALHIVKSGENNGIRIITDNTFNGFVQFGDPENDNIGRLVYSHSENAMQFVTNDSERMRIDASGNVGIGTSSPSQKLEVNGNIQLTNQANSILFGSAGASGTWGGAKISRIDSNIIISDYSGVQLGGYDGTSYGPRVTIKGTGNVGIGTTSPSTLLHLKATSSGQGILINGNQNYDFFRVYDGGGSDEGILDLSTLGTVKIKLHSNGNSYFNGGNVGIGTSSPATKLDVSGGILASGNIATSSGNISAGSGYMSANEYKLASSANNGRFNAASDWGTRHYTDGGYIQFGPANANHAHIYTDRPNFYFNKELVINGNIVWNANNDGSGSGLDADLLDGLHGAQFLRSDVDDTMSGTLNLNGYIQNNPIQGEWYSQIPHAYIGGVSYYKYIKIANIIGATSTATIEYIIKRDSNYPGVVRGTIQVSSYSSASMSVQHDQTTGNGQIGPEVYIDNNRDVWIRGNGAAWYSFIRWRAIQNDGVAILDGSTNQNTQPSNSTIIPPGYSRRFAWNNAASYTDYDNTNTFKRVSTVDLTASSVGIGTSSPDAKLDIEGNFEVGYALKFTNTQGTGNVSGFRSHGVNGQDLSLYNGANRIQRWDENGDSLFDGNVGIGTDSPAYKLDVNADGIGGIRSVTNVNGWAGWFENTNSSSGVVVTAGVDTGDAPLLIRKQDGTELFSVRGNGTSWFNNGNVGVGTTSPDAKLEVVGGVNSAYFIAGGDGSNGRPLTFTSSASASFDGAIHTINATSSQGVIALATGGTERMRITSSGRVGIGTTTPSQMLTVWGGNVYLRGGDSKIIINNIAGATNQEDIVFQRNDSTTFSLGLNSADSFTLFGSNTSTQHIVVNNLGNVGIGTTSPAYKLQVQKTSIATPAFMVGGAYYGGPRIQTYGLDADSNAWMGLGTDMGGAAYEHSIYFPDYGSNGRLTFGTYNGTTYSTKATLLKNGNFGIGTTAPSAKLEVNASGGGLGGYTGIKMKYGTSSVQSLYMGQVTAGNGAFIGTAQYRNAGYWQTEGTASSVINMEAGGNMTFCTNSGLTANTDFNISERMRITSSGNVGIGTTSPQAKLDVNGTISLGGVHGVTQLHNNKDYNNMASGLVWREYNATGTYVHATNSTTLSDFIKSYDFTEQGIASTVNSFTRADDTYAVEFVGYYYANASGTYQFSVSSDDSSDFYIDGTRVAYWYGGHGDNDAPTGGVGQVAGSIYLVQGFHRLYARFQEGTGGDSISLWHNINGGGWAKISSDRLYHKADDLFRATGSGNATLYGTFTATGNVGIGTTAPAYKLDVSGTIRATGDVIAYSDARVKENVNTIENALDKVNQLRGVEYNKIGGDKQSIGVIAQEIEKVLPQVVHEDSEGMKSVAYGNIVGVLIEAIKEQQKQIDELKKRLDGVTN